MFSSAYNINAYSTVETLNFLASAVSSASARQKNLQLSQKPLTRISETESLDLSSEASFLQSTPLSLDNNDGSNSPVKIHTQYLEKNKVPNCTKSAKDVEINANTNLPSNKKNEKLGLHGKIILPKFFHSITKGLHQSGQRLSKQERAHAILALKQSIFEQQKLTDVELENLKKTWAKILNCRELPPKERDRELKKIIIETLQYSSSDEASTKALGEKIYKRLKKQWKIGGAIWGAGLGVPYLLLASGSYLGLIGKVVLSIGATAFTALPNGYLEIALETTMGMIYDAEPAIQKSISNTMSYNVIYQFLKSPTFEILFKELQNRYYGFSKLILSFPADEEWKAALLKRHQIASPFDSSATPEYIKTDLELPRQSQEAYQKAIIESNKCFANLLKKTPENIAKNLKMCELIKQIDEQKMLLTFAQNSVMNYLLPFYDAYQKQNAQTKSGFCDSGRAIVSGVGLLVALGLTLGGVAATLKVPPLVIPAAVLGATLIARITASSFDKSRLRQSRIDSNLKYANVLKDRIPERVEKQMHREIYQIIDPKSKSIDVAAFRNQYTADDVDAKKIQNLWKTATQTRSTWVEKIIAHELSKAQIKIEKTREKLLNFDQPKHSHHNPYLHNIYQNINILLEMQQELDDVLIENKITLQKCQEILVVKNTSFQQLQIQLKCLETAPAHHKLTQQDFKKIKYLKKLLNAHQTQQRNLRDFYHFKKVDFLKLEENGLIYKCLINDRILLKKAIKARYKIAGVVVSQVMRNIGSSMGMAVFSPLMINAVGLALEEGGVSEATAPKMAGSAAAATLWSGMASHAKHSIQSSWEYKPIKAGFEYELLIQKNKKKTRTLTSLGYSLDEGGKKTTELMSISMADIAPTYNKTHPLPKRLKRHLQAAIDIAITSPVRSIKTWVQASWLVHRTKSKLRKHAFLFKRVKPPTQSYNKLI